VGGGDIRKGCRRMNMVEIYIHVYKWKNETIETTLGMGEEGIGESDGGDEFNYNIL
jgi:hypothetical protein